jgi:hypothetical protein
MTQVVAERVPVINKDARFEHLHHRDSEGQFATMGHVERMLASLAAVGAGGALSPHDESGHNMDFSTVHKDGSVSFEVTGDEDDIQFDMPPGDFARLHKTLTDSMEADENDGVFVVGENGEEDGPAVMIAWEKTRKFGGRQEYDLTFTHVTPEASEEFEDPDTGEMAFSVEDEQKLTTTLNMSERDMRDWQIAMTISLLTEPALSNHGAGIAKLAEATLAKRYDPSQPRDDHGRWSKIGEALDAIAKLWTDADTDGSVDRHDVFGAPEGFSDSHGIIAQHGDEEFSLNLHDKDKGTSGLMWLHHDELADLENDLQNALDTDEPGEITAATGRYRIAYDEDGVVLHANIDDDDALEEVFLSRDDVHSLIDVSERLRNPEDPDNPDTTGPLRHGEKIRSGSRKRLGDRGDEFVGAVAILDTPQGPRIRLGAIAQGEDGIKRWTAGQGKTTLDLDEHASGEVADTMERFLAAGRERQKIHDRFTAEAEATVDENGENDWNEIDARERIALGLPLARAGSSTAPFEEDFETKIITTPWGSVRLTDVGMDEPGNASYWGIRMEIWPAGMTEAEYDAGNPDHADWAWPGSEFQKPTADLNARDVRAFVAANRQAFGGEVVAKSARGTAGKVDNQRIAREGRKYWTRSAEGLGKWARRAHPWTALHRHLATKMDPQTADRLTSSYFRAVFGYAPSARQGKNPVGRG